MFGSIKIPELFVIWLLRTPCIEWFLVQVIEGLCVAAQLAPSLAGQQERCGFSTRGAA